MKFISLLPIAEWWLKVRPIRSLKENRVKNILKGAKWTSVLALVIGSVCGMLGVDLAPEQVDVLVNAAAVIAYIVTEYLELRRRASP